MMSKTWRSFAYAAIAVAALVGCSEDVITSPLGSKPSLGVSYSPITVDGNASDWLGIGAVFTDPTEYATDDVRVVRVTNDAYNVYFLVEITLSLGYQTLLIIDADQNKNTGCRYQSSTQVLLGFEGIVVVTPNHPAWPKVRVDKGGVQGDPCQGAPIGQWTTAAGEGPYVEVAVPLAAMQQLGVTRSFNFLVVSANDVSVVGSYVLSGAAPPVQPNTRPCQSFTFRLFNGAECSILTGLRSSAYFNIPDANATDQQLLTYIGSNRSQLETLLLQVDFGRDIKAFLDGSASAFAHERDFYRRLEAASNAALFAQLLGITVQGLGELLAGSLLVQSGDVFSTVLIGIQVYRAGLIVMTNFNTRQLMMDYFATRKAQSIPDPPSAWTDIYNTYGSLVLQIAARQNLSEDQIGTWLENAYLAHRLVGYSDSQTIRQAQGRGIAASAVSGT